MRSAFVASLRLHMVWLMESVGPHDRSVASHRGRRIIVLLLLLPLFLLVQATHWLGFFFDEVFFRSYRKIRIEAPVFITGIPRSGTTFIHRVMAADEAQFTTFCTWEALLAPSITARKLVRALACLDRLIGSPLEWLLAAITRRLTAGFSHIHGVGLKAPEEDYLGLLPAGGCFIAVLAFPMSPSVWRLGRFHELAASQRGILMQFYRRNLQRHLYFHGTQLRLLSKNAAFATWIPDLRRTFPDARFILCIRNPDTALASQLSSVHGAIAFFGNQAATDAYHSGFSKFYCEGYRIMREQHAQMQSGRCAVIEQSRLRAATGQVLQRAVGQVGVLFSQPMREAVQETAGTGSKQKTAHKHQLLEGTGSFPIMEPSVYDNYQHLFYVADA